MCGVVYVAATTARAIWQIVSSTKSKEQAVSAHNGDDNEDPKSRQNSINVAPPSRIFVASLVNGTQLLFEVFIELCPRNGLVSFGTADCWSWGQR